MFLLTAAFAGLISVLRTFPILRGFGGLGFWIVLFAPLWIPVLLLPERTRRERMRPFLAVIPIGWYLVLVGAAYDGPFRFAVATKLSLLFGTLLALSALALSASGWRHLVCAPLWVAIVLGMVLLVAWF
jgi:hypothetical protein